MADRPESTPPPRYHAFDALRAAAMLLGILFHAAISFMEPPIGDWMVEDRSRSLGTAVFVWASHGFRMQVFFVMSGFFAHMLAQRWTVARFLRHRAVRLGVPLAVGIWIHNAIVQSFLHYGESIGVTRATSPEARALLGQPLTGSVFLADFESGHYWFLIYLISFSIGALALYHAGTSWPALGRATGRLRDAFGDLAGHRAAPFALAIVTLPLMWVMDEWVLGGPAGKFWPEPMWLAYYGLFFGFGWALFAHTKQLASLEAHAANRLWLSLPVAAGALFCLQRGLLEGGGSPALQLVTLTLSTLFTWLLVLGTMGLFLRLVVEPSRTWRWVSDSAYWLYLAHIYPVVWLQVMVSDSTAPGLAKYLFVVGVSLAFLFITYQLGVRYTALGAVLNGRRTRPGGAASALVTSRPG